MNGNGKEYAMAMFSIGLENESMDSIHADFETIDLAIRENPLYLEFLVNPAVTKSERLNSLKEVFEERVCEEVFSFLCVLCEHGDMYSLESTIKEFKLMYEDFKHFANAVITSAVELSEAQKAKLIAKLTKVTNKNIRAEYIVDETILGGLTVVVDDKLFDGSVRKNLNNLKEVMS